MARAGDIIYLARRKARISQTLLSQRSGVTQGVISQYESHKVQPSFDAVEHLVACCDLRLDVFLEDRNEKHLPDWVTYYRWRLEDIARAHHLYEVWIAPAAERGGKRKLIAWADSGHQVDKFVASIAPDFGDELEVLDANRLPATEWRSAARSALPLLLSNARNRRETRFTDWRSRFVKDTDPRWYGCRTPGVAPAEFKGRRRLSYFY